MAVMLVPDRTWARRTARACHITRNSCTRPNSRPAQGVEGVTRRVLSNQ